MAETGNRYAMWRLTGVLERAGRHEEAGRWKARATSNRSPGADGTGESLRQKDEAWLRRMMAAGDPVAPLALAELQTEAGRDDEAGLTLREATRDGNEFAAAALAELLRPEQDVRLDVDAVVSASRALDAALTAGRTVEDDWRSAVRDENPGRWSEWVTAAE
ncbi:hypothetical protein ETD86_09610 [Nonomuraea turkmeniaca]|uniref:Sel1 repeat family protein n=1 Tax=Nonomuraea turkmeniaca TaxID=103838 RepID=A0A5S4FQL0_9ACTN|nr:hypothetical protein [Nonomuraea turkmeniaca]TMR22987.1 hypothetical protein ETD86_09610 [Nonomuraea turkmeniaca]